MTRTPFLPQGPLVRGVCFAFFAYTLFVGSDALAKAAGLGGFPTLFIVIVSSWSATVTALILLGIKGQLSRLKPVIWKKHILRAILFLGGFFANITCFTNLPLPVVYVPLFLAPMLITLFGALFMGEPINKKQIFAILLGFFGVLVALYPDQEITRLAGENRTLGYIVLPFFLILLVANMLYLRVMGRTETPESTAYNPFIIRAILLLPCILFVMPETITMVPLLCSIALGIVSCLGFFLLSTAYKIAPVAIISPIHYTQLVTGSLSGYLIWQVAPTKWTFAGGAFIILSGLIVAHEARRQQKEMINEQLVAFDAIKTEQA